MKIYTKTGDTGMTSLASGERVPKHHVRVELYGTIDELNSALGLAIALLGDPAGKEDLLHFAHELQEQQSLLFDLGSELAGYRPASGAGAIVEGDILSLESSIDRMSSHLAPLRSFILPGGTASAAQLHVARTICRRAERQMTALRETQPDAVQEQALVYINRMSDYLFASARYANHMGGIADKAWKSRSSS